MSKMRSPICSVLGHVDHGKSSILDKIRGSAIVKSEAGAITQAIGASIIPLETIKNICGKLLENSKMQFTIPGLLFIDTPGHAAFTSLRRRGGSLADIAIVVVDINEGFKPQTIEAIEILKSFKTPFIIAANKIDLIHGWKKTEDLLLKNIAHQDALVTENFEKKIYELVGKLYEGFSMEADRFDRVSDYTKQVAIVPCSAKTGGGIPELLMVIAGLAQKFLEQCLECDVNGNAKGTILEVKEDKGIGKTIDVILYNGSLKTGDTIVIGGIDGAISTKVKILLQPMPLAEMRDKKSKFKQVSEVVAATGVKISAPDIENVVAGMPLVSCSEEELEQTKEDIQKEVSEVLVEADKEGIVIKADTLGGLEALSHILKQKGIGVRKAMIGNINKKDISDAESNREKNPLLAAILGFNVKLDETIGNESCENVKIFTNDVIYKIIDDFENWQKNEEKRQEAKELEGLVMPCKIKLIEGYVFRQSNPAVVGVEILEGKLKTGVQLMKDGKTLTEVKSMQCEKETVSEAERGKQLAISLPNVIIGRQLLEGETLYSFIPESDFRKLKTLKKHLSKGELSVLKEIAEMMRKNNPIWGV